MKNRLSLIIKILITIAVFMFLFIRFDIRFNDIIRSISNLYLLLLAIIVRLFINPLIYINRWKLFLKHSGIHESFFSLWKMSFISSFLGVILPSSQGGDVVRMVMIEKKHKGFTQHKTASSSVIIERMIGFVLFSLIGLISSLFTPDYPQKEKVIITILSINIALWFILFFITNRRCYLFFSTILKKIKYIRKATEFIDKTHYSLVAFPYKKVLLSSVLLIFLLQISSILIVYLVFLSLDINLPFYQHLSLYPIISILSLIPITISGLGLREGFFVYFYSFIGVFPEVAVSASLINYFIEVIIVALLGGILYLLKMLNFLKI